MSMISRHPEPPMTAESIADATAERERDEARAALARAAEALHKIEKGEVGIQGNRAYARAALRQISDREAK